MSIKEEARAEAEKRHPAPVRYSRNLSEKLEAARYGYENGYIAGASRPVTDGNIAKAAKAIYEAEANYFAGAWTPYESLAEDPRYQYEIQARAALEAVKGVAA